MGFLIHHLPLSKVVYSILFMSTSLHCCMAIPTVSVTCTMGVSGRDGLVSQCIGFGMWCLQEFIILSMTVHNQHVYLAVHLKNVLTEWALYSSMREDYGLY